MVVSGFSNSMSMSVQSIRRAAATVYDDHVSILYKVSKDWLPKETKQLFKTEGNNESRTKQIRTEHCKAAWMHWNETSPVISVRASK